MRNADGMGGGWSDDYFFSCVVGGEFCGFDIFWMCVMGVWTRVFIFCKRAQEGGVGWIGVHE